MQGIYRVVYDYTSKPPGTIEGEEGMDTWLAAGNGMDVAEAARTIPSVPGKYVFHVKSLNVLPIAFKNAAAERLVPTLLYIGKADVSLYQRAVLQECQHRSPGTFFRSVGAMLGYLSPSGGRNYEFARADKAAIVSWIAEHLRISWTSAPVDGSHRNTEKVLIQRFGPLLNLQGNPHKLAELVQLRATCRAGCAH